MPANIIQSAVHESESCAAIATGLDKTPAQKIAQTDGQPLLRSFIRDPGEKNSPSEVGLPIRAGP
jgi:hypothetical protein